MTEVSDSSHFHNNMMKYLNFFYKKHSLFELTCDLGIKIILSQEGNFKNQLKRIQGKYLINNCKRALAYTSYSMALLQFSCNSYGLKFLRVVSTPPQIAPPIFSHFPQGLFWYHRLLLPLHARKFQKCWVVNVPKDNPWAVGDQRWSKSYSFLSSR